MDDMVLTLLPTWENHRATHSTPGLEASFHSETNIFVTIPPKTTTSKHCAEQRASSACPQAPSAHPYVNIPPISRLGMSHPGPQPLSAPP